MTTPSSSPSSSPSPSPSLSSPEPLSETLQRISGAIAAATEASGRPSGAARLLAVSKRQPVESLRAAYEAGQRDFGENYVQEALEKQAALHDLAIVWHFIGPIQTNKTRDIANAFDWVHSVDRSKVAERLSSQRDPGLAPLNVCVQVNLSAEDSKSGVTLEQAEALCHLVSELPNLQLRGLMAIPAPLSTLAQQRAVYAPLKAEFERLAPSYPSLDTLSTGMSADFEAAVAEGSTLVRIGTALFGARAS